MSINWVGHGQGGQSIGVAGLSELQAELAAFPEKISRKIVNRAVKDAGAVLVHAARAEAPARSGVLRNSIRATSVKRGRIGPVLLVMVGGKRERSQTRTIRTPGGRVKMKFKRIDDAFYAPWVEFGTQAHEITAYGKALSFGGFLSRKVQHPGTRASGFFRRAINMSSVHASDTFANRVSALLAQARTVKSL